MGDYHIGKLIKGFRESKSILQRQLYYGLKREGEIYKIESGEQEISKLFVDILLERMGLSTDAYGYEFSIKEYELFQCRADLLEFLEKGQYEEAEGLCGEYERRASKRDKFQQQFIRTIRLLAAMEEGGPPEHLLHEAEQILFLTVPKFKVEKIREYLLSGMERMLVAVQAEALCRMEGEEEKEKGIQMYYSLLFYMEETCTDLWEQEREIPPTVLLMVRWLWKWERYSEIWICEKGIKILRNNMKLTLLEPLMEYEMKGWETGCVPVPEGESAEEWREGLDALEEIREEYKVERKYSVGCPAAMLLALMLKQNFRGQILGETVRRIRKEKGISVEQLAEGICEPETLRRIELGTIRPRQKTYGKLMKKLGQQEYAYHPLICSDDYRMYECYQKLLWHINRFEYEKAEYELKKLENGLNLKVKINYQILMKLYVILKERMNQINQEEKLKYLYKAVNATMLERDELANWPLSREELVLWNNIAETLEIMGKKSEAMTIWQSIKKYYEESAIALLNNKKEYMFSLCNFSTFLGKEGKHQKALEFAKYGIKLCLEWGQGNYLAEYLYMKVWNMEHIMEKRGESEETIKKTCLPILKQAFLTDVIMRYTFHKRHIENHCEKYYGISIDKLF